MKNAQYGIGNQETGFIPKGCNKLKIAMTFRQFGYAGIEKHREEIVSRGQIPL